MKDLKNVIRTQVWKRLWKVLLIVLGSLLYGFVFQAFRLVLYLAVPYHDNNKLCFLQKLSQIVDLVFDHIRANERIVNHRRRIHMLMAENIQQLKRRTLTGVVHIFLVGKSVKSHTGKIFNSFFRHDLLDPFINVFRHGVIYIAGRVDQRGKVRKISDQEPGID